MNNHLTYLTGSNFVYMGVVGEGSLLSHFPFGLEMTLLLAAPDPQNWGRIWPSIHGEGFQLQQENPTLFKYRFPYPAANLKTL